MLSNRAQAALRNNKFGEPALTNEKGDKLKADAATKAIMKKEIEEAAALKKR